MKITCIVIIEPYNRRTQQSELDLEARMAEEGWTCYNTYYTPFGQPRGVLYGPLPEDEVYDIIKCFDKKLDFPPLHYPDTDIEERIYGLGL